MPKSKSMDIMYDNSTIRLGHTLQFVLLLDRIGVARSLCSVDELIGQALGDRLDVPESGLTGSSAKKPDCLKPYAHE